MKALKIEQQMEEHFSYEFGPFRIVTATRSLLFRGEPVSLMPKSFDALVVLVRHRGQLLEKAFLLNEIWPDIQVEENNLAQAVSDIRKALGEGPKDQRYVATVPRFGYRFVANVKTIRYESNDATGPAHSIRHGTPESAVVDAPRETIAVLPFTSLDTEGGDESFEVGIADALITRLSNIRAISVRPTHSILKYVRTYNDPVLVGHELKVDSIVSGSIRRLGARVRVTVQLVRVVDKSTLWAEKFDEAFTDIFTVEDSISERVAAVLSLRLSGEEKRALAKRYTEDTEAYQLFLKGRYFLSRRTAEGAQKAIDHFSHAIELDQLYALAYTGLADSYLILGLQGAIMGGLPPHKTYPHARQAAVRALELDDMLAEAHASFAHIKFFYDWDWQTAERGFLRAIELNPNYATAHHWYALALMFMGREECSLTEIKTAQEIDPLSLVINTNMGYLLYYARRHDEAITQLQKTVEMDPSFATAHHRLGLAFEAKGMFNEAIVAFQEAERISRGGPLALGMLGHVYACLGRKAQARRILKQLIEQSERFYVSGTVIAEVYAGMGENESALEWLNKAFDEHSISIVGLKVNTRYDCLRSDRRFQHLLRRVGLWS